jgi:ABC-type glycerol-3-phosphate transport system substrate-binding protein
MKKILTILLLPIFALVLVSCKPDKADDGIITITYSNWNLGSVENKESSMERIMIDEFMKKYDNIKVEIVERPQVPGTSDDMNWTEFLSSKAAVQTLPDVFMADNIPFYVVSDWAYNITAIANADPEFLNISNDIRSVATYDGKVMAIPNAVFYAGYFVNKTLYDNQGQEAPTVTSTFNELIALTKAAADHTSNTNTGVGGLNGIEHIMHYYPAHLNKDFGWFTLSDKGFNLDSAEFTQTMEFYRTLQEDHSFVLDALNHKASQEDSDIDTSVIFPITSSGNQFESGNILANFDYSWSFSVLQKKINEGEIAWDIDFIGTPVINGKKIIPTVSDFFTVASSTKHPEEAYLLAKWMGFGKDGYLKRIELGKTNDKVTPVNFAPVQNDKDLLDKYFDLYPDFSSLRKMIEDGFVIVEPPKYLPGYVDARYKGTYDAENTMDQIINKVRYGDVLLADVKTALNNAANKIYNDAKKDFDVKIKLR